LISSEQKLSGSKLDFKAKDADERHDKLGQQAVYAVIWKALLCLSVDSNRGVASAAAKLVDHVNFQLLSAPIAQTLTPVLQQHALRGQSLSTSSMGSLQQSAVPPSTPEYSTSTLGKSTASKMANTLKRSASLAVTLKSLIPGYSSASPSSSDTTKAASISASSLWPGQESTQSYGQDSRVSNGGATGTTRTVRSTAPRPRSVHGDAGYLQAQSSPSYGQIQASPSSNGSASLAANTPSDANQPGARPHVESVFYDWCCEYFLEPQMKVRSGISFFSQIY